jgi:hypothetical protein
MSAERRDRHRDERRRDERRNNEAQWNHDRRHQSDWKERRDRDKSRPRPPSNHGGTQNSCESHRVKPPNPETDHPNHGRHRPVGKGGPWTSKMEAMWLVLPDSELSKDGKLRERTEFEIDEEFRAADRGKMEKWNKEMTERTAE